MYYLYMGISIVGFFLFRANPYSGNLFRFHWYHHTNPKMGNDDTGVNCDGVFRDLRKTHPGTVPAAGNDDKSSWNHERREAVYAGQHRSWADQESHSENPA